MTREEARKAAEVMLAYDEGKTIEFKIKGEDRWSTWNKEDGSVLGFEFDEFDYRIKREQEREPSYRPFKDKDECWAEMQKHQPFGWIIDKNTKVYYSITALNDICSYFAVDFADGYSHLFKGAVFADGTPFGIKKE